MSVSLFKYVLQLADNTLILGQRNSEWTGHGPVLEQDIAITNISLDLLGQARNFFQYGAYLYNNFDFEEKKIADNSIPGLWKSYNRELNEDDLAFLRDEKQYLNLLLTELPKGDWATTITRQLIFSVFQLYQYESLMKIGNQHLSAIAEKSLKEVIYHVRWSGEWVIRLGDGTNESNKRMKKAIMELWPYTGEMFVPADYETVAVAEGNAIAVQGVQTGWEQKIKHILYEGGLEMPDNVKIQQGGKTGMHTEHFRDLIEDMQLLQRAYPNLTW